MTKPILCLDFDGVCHSYTSGWQGPTVCADEPVDGLFEFLEQVYVYFDIYIYSSRSHQDGGIEAMQCWFTEHAVGCSVEGSWARVLVNYDVFDVATSTMYRGHDVLYMLYFPDYKPPAMLTIDDRAVCFTGLWPSVEALLAFKPWNKRLSCVCLSMGQLYCLRVPR